LEQICQFIDDHDGAHTEATICEAVNRFSNVLCEAAEPDMAKVIKLGQKPRPRTSDTIPWYDKKVEAMKDEFFEKLNVYREDESDINRINMVKARSHFKSAARLCRLNYNRTITHNLLVARKHNAKEYWKLLKGAAGVSDKSISSDTFAEYFSSINNPDDPFFQVDDDVAYFVDRYVDGDLQIMFAELNVDIDLSEIDSAIHQLKSEKSAGPDMLINEFFIHGKDVLLPVLHNLFNAIFRSGIFPEEWSEGYVIPLHKKGDKNNVDNYRGITLLSCLGKLFTRILNTRLTEWAELYSVYVDGQAGFRAGYGTVENIYVLHGLITHFVNSGKMLFCSFVDFSKAFDLVVHDNLWYKLIQLGLRGNILNIVKNMYTHVKSRVKSNDGVSAEFDCFLGVRQGESLSPFLFAMYINDLEEFLSIHGYQGVDITYIKLFLLLYADDIILMSETSSGLQHGLDMLFEYCNRWKLKVNAVKTKVMVFKKGGSLPATMKFVYNGNNIEIVSRFAYLGLIFTPGGSFAEAHKTLSNQARKGIFAMRVLLRKCVGLTPKHQCSLFDRMISPILNYGCEIWGLNKADPIEKVHVGFCKNILHVKSTTQNGVIYGELGRYPLLLNRQYRVIKYWLNIVSGIKPKYVCIVYQMLLDDLISQPTATNWAGLVRQLLFQTGFAEVWYAQGVHNIHAFLCIFKTRILDMFDQTWHSDLEDSAKARSYILYANTLNYKVYLDAVNVDKYRIALCHLRLSSHRLAIETGRWHKPKPIAVGDRKCTICGVVEDEYHFLMECVLYKHIRKNYIPAYYVNKPSMVKFIELLGNEEPTLLKRLAVFVYKAFDLRKTVQ
jgi:hypothetical protein